MGAKGDKLSNDAFISSELLRGKPAPIPGITSKKMFGGYGIFQDGKMFALVNSKGEMYLKADEAISSKFEGEGSRQHGKMPYFSIPKGVLADHEKPLKWAKESIDISK